MSREDPLKVAGRLEALGIHVQSAELQLEAERYRVFYEGGGNRAMRRAEKKRKARANR